MEVEDTIIERNSRKRTQDSSKKIVKIFDDVADYSEIDLKIREYGKIRWRSKMHPLQQKTSHGGSFL